MNMDIKPYYFDYAQSGFAAIAKELNDVWELNDVCEVGKTVVPPKHFNCKHCGAVGQSGVCEYCGSAEE